MGQSWTALPMASCHFHVLPHVCPWRWGNGWRCFMPAWTQTKIYFSMPWWHVAPWPQGAVAKAEWWLHISQCFHSSSPCGSFTVFYQFISVSPGQLQAGMYRDWLGWGSTPQHQGANGLVRKKCCCLHFPWLALAPFPACPLAEMLNADEVPLGPLPEESLIKAIRWELEHTVVSHAVCQGSPGSRDHVSALLLMVPWGSLNKIKTRRNHPSFCRTL